MDAPRHAWRVVVATLGLVLLVAAVIVAVRGIDVEWSLLATPRAASLGLLLVALAATCIAIPAWMFWRLLRHESSITLAEMTALLASTTLMGYAAGPLAPVGRVAYLKRVHGVPVRSVVGAMIAARAATLAAAGPAAALVAPVTLLVTPLGVVCLWFTARFSGLGARAVLGASVARAIEVGVWGARYWVAFHVLGHALPPSNALALAAASTIAQSVPAFPGAIGIREWSTALAAVLIDPTVAFALTLSADLLNRGADVVIAVVAGSATTPLVLARWRRDRPAPPQTGSSNRSE